MTCALRVATAGDYEALCALFEEVDAQHRDALPHVWRKPEGPPRSRDYILSILADEDHRIFVAESAGRIVGFVHVYAGKSRDIPLFVPRRFALVDDIVVASAFRRQGVGRALLDRAHGWAREMGLTQMELVVWEFNEDAIRFYEGLGYTTANRRMWTTLKSRD